MTSFATLEDLQGYLGFEPPAKASQLLDKATRLVKSVTTSSIYAVDSSGNATDATIIAALRDATCIQAEYWISNGGEDGSTSGITSWSIEGISVTKDPNATMRSYRLCDGAWDALREAKIVPGTVAVW